MVRMINPWPNKTVRVIRLRDHQPTKTMLKGDLVEFSTEPEESYRIEPAS